MVSIINRRQPIMPAVQLSNDSSDSGEYTNGLYRVGGNGSGGGGGDNDPNGDGHAGDINGDGHNGGYNNRRSEFMLVKASNINVTIFIGTNLIANPYSQFYTSMRRLIYSQGEDDEVLLNMLTEIEKKAAMVFTNEQLKAEVQQYPKVSQFNRAIFTALLSYTAGIARGMVEYGVENGLDAWRRFYHHYMPLADDLQQLLIQELYALTPVTESNVDTLFNKVERIFELYTRHGVAEDQLSDKWIKAALMRNSPKQITKDLVIQLKDAKTTGEVRHLVNVYMHDYQIGMPRGANGTNALRSCTTGAR